MTWDASQWDDGFWGGVSPAIIQTDSLTFGITAVQTAGLATFVLTAEQTVGLLLGETSTSQSREILTASLTLSINPTLATEAFPPGKRFTPPTYDVLIDNEGLWRWGYTYPRTHVVVIYPDGSVTPYPGAVALTDPDDLFSAAKDGTGDNGKSVYRRRSYRLVSQEDYDYLAAAGYGEHLEPTPTP